MSDETRDDTAGVMNQAENPEEKCPQEGSSADDSAADELFDSFMEIATDPQLQDEQPGTTNGVIDEVVVSSDPSALQLKDSNRDGEKQDTMNGTSDQGETDASSNPSMPQHNDSNSNRDELQIDAQTGTNDQGETTESDQKDSLNRTLDQDETRESSDLTSSPVTDVDSSANEQSCPQASEDVERDDSSLSVSVNSQLDSDGVPVQGATEIPTETCDKTIPNPVFDEGKPGELIDTTESVQSNSDATSELQRTEECLENSSDVNLIQTADNNKNDSVDNADVSSGDKEDEVTTSSDPKTSKTDVAKRLSKAMEELAGLEQQLCSAVTEMKQSNENKFNEESDEEGLTCNIETKEDQVVESKNEEQVVSQATVTDEVETEEKGVLVLKENASQDSEEVMLTTDGGSDRSVCETDEKANVCEPDTASNVFPDDSNNRETLLENVDKESKDAENSKADTVDDIHDENKGTDVGVAEVQEGEKESTVSTEQDIPPSNKDLQVDDSNVLTTSKTADVQEDARQEVDVTEPTNTEESSRETTVEDSKNDNGDASIEKSDSANELDMEVASSGMAIPDIEITTDESGISERKSLDSLDTEESSNSRPASPELTDDGIDSDTPSDYGDDDDNNTFDPDNLGASSTCKRKSWLLETDRDRLSSDSSTVSEKDFRESFSKGDSADGKSPKEDYIRGHLLKMGGSGLTPKNWRKRWFVLRGDNCLYYYKQSKDKVPCGVIILSNYSISKAPEISKPHCFKLTKGGARTYYMCAGSDPDMKKWMMAMMDAIKGSSGSSNPFNLFEGSVHNVSIPALSIRDPDCHGYLYKQGQGIKAWKRRYFVLKNGFLYYYSDMSNTVALGVAKLLDYTINAGEHTGKKFYFSAVSTDPSLRTYFFAAESDMDRTRWLSRLEDSIRKGATVC